ncbi:hypothetical protein F4804DRAFT_330059 [Jackrogersella minutella]|nr:hypothetical protein F4804DRAFT_330059 [Jackrogersella minutella]
MSLALHRTAHGQDAVSFNLDWMRKIGTMAENAADMIEIKDNELMALLKIYWDPNRPVELVSQASLL